MAVKALRQPKIIQPQTPSQPHRLPIVRQWIRHRLGLLALAFRDLYIWAGQLIAWSIIVFITILTLINLAIVLDNQRWHIDGYIADKARCEALAARQPGLGLEWDEKEGCH